MTERTPEIMAEIRGLLRAALDCAERGECASALWRAVDAAGLLSEIVCNRRADGIVPTGRGFRIVKE